MNNYILKVVLFCVLGIFLNTDTEAQVPSNSPYSVGGIGALKSNTFFPHQFMGGIGSSIADNNNFSLQNPASLAEVDFTLLQFGTNLQIIRQYSGPDTGFVRNGQFDYVNLAFPLFEKKEAAISIGIRPKSNMNYLITNQQVEFDEDVVNIFEGRGGVNQLDLSYGMKILKGLSLGASAHFMFGQTEQMQDKQFEESINQFSFQDRSTVFYSGFQGKVGVQYNGRLFKKIHHGLGGYFELGGNLSSELDRTVRTYNAGGNFFIDTILTEQGKKQELALPSGYGISYHIGMPERWLLGAEYQTQAWSGYQGINARVSHLDRTILSVGGYVQPGKLMEGKRTTFDERLKYYLGITRFYFGYRMEDTYTSYLNNTIKETGINFGLGLPVVRYYKDPKGIKVPVISRAYIGVEYIKRGEPINDLIQENILQIKLGLTFSDKWFVKKKYQ